MKKFMQQSLYLLLILCIVSCQQSSDAAKSAGTQSGETAAKSKTAPSQSINKNFKAPAAKGDKRILFVGNSHTEYFISLPDLFKALCKENQQNFQVETLVEMGASLEEVYQANKARAIKTMVQKDADGNYFDYVLLQEKTPITIESLDNYKANVKMLVDQIHKNSPETVVLIYELMDPFDFKKEKDDFDYFYPKMRENALSVVKEYTNVHLLPIGTAVKQAYEGKHGYDAYKGGKDLLRYGQNTLHMLNDAGFLSAVLLYETIFDQSPKIPSQLPLNQDINTRKISTLKVADAISNKEALMKIATDF